MLGFASSALLLHTRSYDGAHAAAYRRSSKRCALYADSARSYPHHSRVSRCRAASICMSERESAVDVVRAAALGGNVDARKVIASVEELETKMDENSIINVSARGIEGLYQLTWTSALAGVPLANGRMPVYETVEIRGVDSPDGDLQLVTSVFGLFQSKVGRGDIWGWDAASQTLSFNMKAGKPAKCWRFIYADDSFACARSSSLTGINLLKRLSS